MPIEGLPLPAHIGIIMDGNGRWASERKLPRSSGHKEGLEVAKNIVSHASDIGIKAVSLYVFSSENWRRAEREVDILMNLIKTHLRRHYSFYRKNGLRIIHSGSLDELPVPVRDEIHLAENETGQFKGMRVNLLINYGGRNEIVRAVRRLAKYENNLEHITEDHINRYLDHPEIPDLDLIIRTGGELRLSNFFLWQSAYAELYFSSAYWPDWTPAHLDDAISHYRMRKRRFGEFGHE